MEQQQQSRQDIDYHQILQNLYLGNQKAATNPITFFQTGAKAICVCGSYLKTQFQHRFQYKKYQILDHPNQKIKHLFQQNYNWIKQKHKQGKSVFVHCAFGVSRSATFVIAFLMRDKNWSYLNSYNYVKKIRAVIDPNEGFINQLKQYQKELKILNQQLIVK